MPASSSIVVIWSTQRSATSRSDGWTRAYCWTASLAVRSTAGAAAARGGRGEGRCPSGRLGVTM